MLIAENVRKVCSISFWSFSCRLYYVHIFEAAICSNHISVLATGPMKANTCGPYDFCRAKIKVLLLLLLFLSLSSLFYSPSVLMRRYRYCAQPTAIIVGTAATGGTAVETTAGGAPMPLFNSFPILLLLVFILSTTCVLVGFRDSDSNTVHQSCILQYVFIFVEGYPPIVPISCVSCVMVRRN